MMNQVKGAGVFIPPWSERFGKHLRVNLGSPPQMKCSWDCFYCPMKEQRSQGKGWLPIETLQTDLERMLDSPSESLDSVLIVAAADPTLHPDFEKLIPLLTSLRSRRNMNWSIGCLINGSSLIDTKLQKPLSQVDELCIKLDCADPVLFNRINHPCASAGTLENHLDGIKKLKRFNLQTTVWRCPERPEFGNWTQENLEGLYRLYEQLKPQNLYLTTLSQKKRAFEILPVNDSELGTFGLRVQELGIHVRVNHMFPGGVMSG